MTRANRLTADSRVYYYILSFFVTLVLIFLLVGLFFFSVDRVVKGDGTIIMLEPSMQVKVPTKSIVTKVYVSEGDEVKKGALLVEFDSALAKSTLEKSTEEQRLAEKTTTAADLFLNATPVNGDTSTNPLAKTYLESFANQVKKYQYKIYTDEQVLDKLNLQRDELESYRRVLDEIFQMWHNAYTEEKYASRSEYLKAKSELQKAQQELSSLNSRIAEKEGSIKIQRSELEAFKAEWRAKMADKFIDGKSKEIKSTDDKKRAKFEFDQTKIYADFDSYVLDLADLSSGSVIGAEQLIMNLVPVRSSFVASLSVKNQDISLLKIGDEVDIKFETLPYQKHGSYKGRVLSIGPDINSKKSISVRNSGAMPRQELESKSYDYTVMVSLIEDNLKSVPKSFRMAPGLKITGFIKVGTRKISEYLIFPIQRAMDEAFRE